MGRQRAFDKVLAKVVEIRRDDALNKRLKQFGLIVVNVMSENTARSVCSA